MTNIRILILNYEYPPLGGGAGIVSKHLTEEFAKMGHSVTVLTTWYAGEPEFFVDENITIIRLKSKRKNTFQSNPYEMLSWQQAAMDYFKNQNTLAYDICLANFTMPGGAVAKYLKQKFNIPYIILSHGHDIPWAYPKIMFVWHLLFYKVIKEICKQSSAVILLSEEIKQMADKFMGEKYAFKNKIFYNGLYTERFEKTIVGDKLKIAFVGRLVAQKSPMLFMKVIKELQKENIPFEVSIFGDGELKIKMEEYAETNKLHAVAFRGKVGHAEVLKAMTESNLMVSTSESEGMSMAILEAISAGVYVIATNVSGNDNMIMEDVNGNLVDVNNPLQIVEKIKSFYTDKLLKHYTFPEDYIERMESMFSWNKITRQYEKLFFEILK